jgi:cell division protein FtsN
MVRDYKRTENRAAAAERPFGSWLSFATGLGIGLVVATLVYFWKIDPRRLPGAPSVTTPEAAETIIEEPSNPDPLDQQQSVIPKIEVKVPEAELPPPTAPAPATDPATEIATKTEAGTYILQAGSFQRFEEADQAKAQLALQGVQATIQRVVINGHDVWHRVHVGPYRTLQEVQTVRTKLSQIGLNAIVLKLGGGEQ